ncbi:cytochrome P450 [Punctularia strigosozonata HHB-11173 SS5]|uniref:cytochrome P450 n=1 Tax=Punctularia strigosozonata (strain HHB-11173) TaxID=741275 RepID=UPI0004416864|nr:cytochrome P450 [Punctularia strigosozonata HHB-11173 SS5]EIN06781.1 cytochrome P450 [Punctularia strigosozonata HHB-11173 SS5]
MPNTVTVIYSAALLTWSLRHLYRRYAIKSILRVLPRPPDAGFLTGHLLMMFDPWSGVKLQEEFATLGSVFQVNGLIGDEQIYVTDPRALHHILVKDETKFEETRAFIELNKLIFGDGILSAEGAIHRAQRRILNPHFSTNNLRTLMPTFTEVVNALNAAIATDIRGGLHEIDMLNWLSRASLDIMGRAGVGYDFGALNPDRADNEYTAAIKNLLPAVFPFAPFMDLMPDIRHSLPPRFRRFLVDVMALQFNGIRRVRDIVDTMYRSGKEIYARRKSRLESSATGTDIFSMLVKSNTNLPDDERMPEESLIAQISMLVFAGTDTTSAAMARALSILADHQDVQQRLREEVIDAFTEYATLTHDELMALPYLDAVIKEVLRLHPPAYMFLRTAREDTTLPLAFPVVGTDGRTIHEVPIRKRQQIIMGLGGTNSDERIWGPDAKNFKPERWLKPLPGSVAQARVPGVWANQMTFISGPRACLGFKLAEIEMKLTLATLLRDFVFSPGNEEIFWKLGFVVQPHAAGQEHGPPHMPLKVTAVKRE